MTLTDKNETRIEHITAIGPDVSEGEAEIQVLPFGTHETELGTFTLDAEGITEIIAECAARKSDMVVDYEHQTLKGVEAPAAGWITALIDKGADGLWARVRWTARALEYISNREYRYLSPVFLTEDSTGRVTRLVNLALTNQPAIDGMAPVAAKRTHETEVKGMKEIFAILGLAPEAKPEEAVEALKALIAQRDALMASGSAVDSGILSALGLSDGASLEEAIGMAAALRLSHEEVSELASKLEDAASRLRAIETEALVDDAMREGKVTPAQKEWALKYAVRDPEGFTAFVAKAPVVVRHASLPRRETKPSGLDELQREANRITGVSEAVYLKHHARARSLGE